MTVTRQTDMELQAPKKKEDTKQFWRGEGGEGEEENESTKDSLTIAFADFISINDAKTRTRRGSEFGEK